VGGNVCGREIAIGIKRQRSSKAVSDVVGGPHHKGVQGCGWGEPLHVGDEPDWEWFDVRWRVVSVGP